MHTEPTTPLHLFEWAPTAHALLPLPFSPYPVTKRRRLASPTQLSRIPRGTNIASALQGAAMQGLPLLRHGEEVAALCEARTTSGFPLYRTVGVMIPRRAAKTTSVWSVILGRCISRRNYKVVTTAQDGIRARNRFREVQRILEAADFEGRLSPANRRGRLRWANGDESIEFDNGSRVWVVPPEAGAFRGEAADLFFIDEAGEINPQRSADLVAGALPLMDTRPDGQVIIAGTPGKVRAGLLWDTMRAGETPKSKVGIVSYAIRDDEPSTILSDDGEPALNTRLLRRVHPGIGTLTTLEVMTERFARMTLPAFESEYLCRFPFDASVSAIPAHSWNACSAATEIPPRPDRIGLAFDVAPDGSSAALAAAWRDEFGIGHLEILGYLAGTGWLVGRAAAAARKYRSAIAHDTIGANTDIADQLHRARVRLAPMGLRHIQGAAARLVADIDAGRVRHYNQPDLDAAVDGAAWRSVGDGGRLFSRKHSAADVCPLVAASVALWQADQLTGRLNAKITLAGTGTS